MHKDNNYQYILAQSELNSQAKISSLIEIAARFQTKAIDAKARKKDFAYLDVHELEILTDELLSVSGSLSGDLNNCYSTIKRQSLNATVSERIEDITVSTIAREVWQLIESAKSNVSPLAIAK